MSSAREFVDDATALAKALIKAESRFPGDYGRAMGAVATRIGIPRQKLWDLHYRKPKSIGAEIYFALLGAMARGSQDADAAGRNEFRTALLRVAELRAIAASDADDVVRAKASPSRGSDDRPRRRYRPLAAA